MLNTRTEAMRQVAGATLSVSRFDNDEYIKDNLQEIMDLDGLVSNSQISLDRPLVRVPHDQYGSKSKEIIAGYAKILMVLATMDSKVVGAVAVEVNGDYEKTLVVSWISVLKEYRRQGIGKQLMDKVMELVRNAKGVDHLTLGVSRANTSAVAMYQQLGFEVFSHYMLVSPK